MDEPEPTSSEGSRNVSAGTVPVELEPGSGLGPSTPPESVLPSSALGALELWVPPGVELTLDRLAPSLLAVVVDDRVDTIAPGFGPGRFEGAAYRLDEAELAAAWRAAVAFDVVRSDRREVRDEVIAVAAGDAILAARALTIGAHHPQLEEELRHHRELFDELLGDPVELRERLRGVDDLAARAVMAMAEEVARGGTAVALEPLAAVGHLGAEIGDRPPPAAVEERSDEQQVELAGRGLAPGSWVTVRRAPDGSLSVELPGAAPSDRTLVVVAGPGGRTGAAALVAGRGPVTAVTVPGAVPPGLSDLTARGVRAARPSGDAFVEAMEQLRRLQRRAMVAARYARARNRSPQRACFLELAEAHMELDDTARAGQAYSLEASDDPVSQAAAAALGVRRGAGVATDESLWPRVGAALQELSGPDAGVPSP